MRNTRIKLRWKKPRHEPTEPNQEHMAELYETLVNSSPVGVYVVQNGRFQFVNPQFQKYTGFSQGELLNMDSLSVVYPEDRGLVRENAVKMLRGERSSPYEFRIITRSRQVRWLMEAVTPTKHKGKRAVLGNCIDVTKQIEARKRLEELEALESSILDAAPNPFLVLHNGRIVFANDAVEAIFGWKPEELMGKTAEVLFPTGKKYEEVSKGVDSMFEEQGAFSEELPCRRKDGREIICLVKGSRIGESSKESKIVAAFEEITDRKKLDEELQKQRQELNRRVKELNCLYTISNLVRQQDISLGEICKGIVALIPLSLQHPQMTGVRLILEGQEFRMGNYEEAVYKQARDIIVDGKPVGTLEVCYSGERPQYGQEPFREEEIHLINTIASQLAEIIKHRQAWDTLQTTQANLRHLITKNADGMIVIDKNGVVRFVNQAAEALFGRKAEELVGESFGYPVVAGDKTEIDIVRDSGETATAEMRMVEIEWDGESACLASLHDITERKRIEQMKSEFISVVSNQLKTPAAEIEGYIDRMLVGLTGDLTVKQREYLEQMREISRKNLHLISDLLDISSIERGVIPVDIRPVKLKEIVDLAVLGCGEKIKGKGLVLNLEERDGEMTVLADKDKIVGALSNVIDSAVKLTDEGAITIKTKGEKGFGIVEVADTGKGLSYALLDKLSKKEQIFAGTIASEDGLGLGLYIAKNFMELQRGNISVSSITGKGSTFILRIPSARFEIPL